MIQITEDNDMLVTSEDGETRKIKILFYFHNDERQKDYYFLFEEESPDEIFVMASSDGESLEEIGDEEYDEAEQVFAAYMEDPKIAEAKK